MKNAFLYTILCFFAALLMLLHTDYVTEGARYGLLLWYQSVVPALFPFMVLSGLIQSMGGIERFMIPVHRILKHIFPLSASGCFILISGLFCGYPMGAKLCADFLKLDRIALNEARFLMAICSHPSPMFLIGYTYPMVSDHVRLADFMIGIYAPIIIVSFAAKHIYFHSEKLKIHPDYTYLTIASGSDTSDAFPIDESIMSSVAVLCKIGGYLVLCSIAIVFLRNTDWLPLYVRIFLIGITEMTTGIREITTAISGNAAWIAVTASLTFGGLSGIFQINSVILDAKKAGLSIRPYIHWKLFHAALSVGFVIILCNLR